ncbi:2-amino-4-hydroxy-6-hydroxymethyldihydropteridine diphosphokinase [Chryseosolibacter indicus]|uniref:2-amino-4-hydroxy-6-hydroxymethyldihydropteridine pyrophosphokinase n=1 Tax=Chryseosolibacter indicus TaxID=2782351 RepID=A0ABS5VLS3_9BACT|nr:2-amino-4-hydroxy-6-hydroxymethyldihydropteridine diphosphokinase [Chryseosolibacter indicus]MBT1702321.1 2-amino-4-hydroxy-6-hydroxymethyldihydropteridine diphosphokinase [Chryseosolibacter indicus]
MGTNTGVYLSLGTNQGNRKENLNKALARIAQDIGKVTKLSSIYSTKPWGKKDQDDFLNQVILIETTFDPTNLLDKILNIERDLGRVREEKWGPRIIDIDVLFYGDVVINIPELTIPHPAIAERKFILIPLDEISPEYVHPLLNKKVRTLLDECSDPLDVQLVEML